MNDQSDGASPNLLNDGHLVQAMLRSTLQGVWIIDQNGHTIYLNQVMADILGRTVDEVMGKTLLETIPTDEHDDVQAAFAARQSGDQLAVNYTVYRPDGTTRQTQVYASPIMDQHSTFRGALALFTDITPLEQAHNRLRAKDAQLEIILGHLPIILFVLDEQGTFILVKGNGLDAFDLTPETLMGTNIYDELLLLPELQGAMKLALNGDPAHICIEHFERTYISYLDPIQLDEAHPNNGMIGIMIDMTDQARVESALQTSEERYRMILETTDDIVYTLDRNGYFTSLNPAFERVLGHKADDWVGQAIITLCHEEDDHLTNMVQRTLAGENVPIYEIRLHSTTDKWVILEVNQQPIREQDAIIGVLGIARDITERRRMEIHSMELALERERLTMLSRFIHDVSHDIRTPLSIISSNAYLARRKLQTETDDVEKHLHRIEAHVNDLGKQLTELLTLDQLAKPENHTITDVELNGLVSHVMAGHDLLARKKHHEMVFAPHPQPVYVRGNADDLTRVIRHLVVNALNYTADYGSIRVSVMVKDTEAVISVQDNGIGIDRHNQTRIFEPFFRVDSTRNHDTGGMGLGLNVSKLIVEAHHGHIEVESEVERGSTFRVILPLRST